jgi:hypothetical protein
MRLRAPPSAACSRTTSTRLSLGIFHPALSEEISVDDDTHRATSFDRTPPNQQLLADLQSYGGAALDGRIQCVDSACSCIAALYQARLRETTGFIHDCYMLDPTNPVSRSLRQRFWSEMNRVSPQVIGVTDSVCYSQPRNFDKYAMERPLVERRQPADIAPRALRHAILYSIPKGMHR